MAHGGKDILSIGKKVAEEQAQNLPKWWVKEEAPGQVMPDRRRKGRRADLRGRPKRAPPAVDGNGASGRGPQAGRPRAQTAQGCPCRLPRRPASDPKLPGRFARQNNPDERELEAGSEELVR